MKKFCLIGNFVELWRFSVDSVHFDRVELILKCGLMSKEIEKRNFKELKCQREKKKKFEFRFESFCNESRGTF